MEHADSSCPLCCREIAPREGGSEQQVAGAGELRAGVSPGEIVSIREVAIIQAHYVKKESDRQAQGHHKAQEVIFSVRE